MNREELVRVVREAHGDSWEGLPEEDRELHMRIAEAISRAAALEEREACAHEADLEREKAMIRMRAYGSIRIMEHKAQEQCARWIAKHIRARGT